MLVSVGCALHYLGGARAVSCVVVVVVVVAVERSDAWYPYHCPGLLCSSFNFSSIQGTATYSDGRTYIKS